jgi:hypothetical protein
MPIPTAVRRMPSNSSPRLACKHHAPDTSDTEPATISVLGINNLDIGAIVCRVFLLSFPRLLLGGGFGLLLH